MVINNNTNKKINITIIGSGSAGLLTSLIFKNKIPNSDVSIIHDKNTPVIGVGESTLGSFSNMLTNYAGIDIYDFNNNVKPVTKYGIWFDFGKKEFHFPFDNSFDFEYNNKLLPIGFDYDGGNFGNTPFSVKMIKNDTPFSKETGAVHIDNKKLLKYLEKIAIERGIKFIDDKITSIQKEGDVILSLNKKYKADYFIDCSGFKPLLSKEKFHSYEDILVKNKALFFRTKTKNNIRSYTKSSTMNSGWLWEIDHSQGYTGNGYVYSSKYISDEDALKEVQKKLGIEITNYRVIPFKTGRLEKHWVGNVITIGNADGFVEPLEATSLLVILFLAKDVASIIKYGDNKGDLIDRYNIFVNKYYDTIKDFISMHFCFNDKLDTKYWKDYKKRIKLIPKDSLGYDILKYYLINNTHIKFLSHVYNDINPYGIDGWYSVLRGLIPDKKSRDNILSKL